MRHDIRPSFLLFSLALALVFGARPAVAQQLPAAAGRLAVTPAPRQTAPVKPVQPKPPAKPRAKPVPDTRRWDIQAYAGFGFGSTSAGGTGALPPPGESFNTAGGSATRRVASWYFGDGAALLNGVLGSYGRPERMSTALDEVLTRQAVEHGVGDGFGARVTRTMTKHLTLEVGFEYASTTFTVLPSAINGIKTASDAFPAAFAGLVATGQGVAFTNPVLSSTYTVVNGTGSEVLTTGAIILGRRAGRFRPYMAAGGGIVKAGGEASATLAGRYAFSLPSGGRVDESDSLSIHFKGGLGFVALAGGGLSVHLTRASGIRADGRLLIVQNHVQTTVDSSPVVAASLPADAIWSNLTPGIQFSTNPSTGLSSSLSAPALSDFRTLKGSGFHTRLSLTVGYFWRF